MARNSADRGGSRTGLGIAASVVSGTLVAAAMLLVKIAVGNIALSAAGVFNAVANPLAIMALILGVAGFLAMQYGLRFWHIAAVIPLITGVGILVSNVLAFALIGEIIPALRWVGIFIILIGIILFIAKEARMK